MSSAAYLFGLLFVCTLAAQANGESIPGAYVVQISGDCDDSCLQALQSKLDASSDTEKCAVGAPATTIGSLSFVDITCESSDATRDLEIEDEPVASALFAEPSISSGVFIQVVQQDFVVSTAAVPTSLWGVDEADGGVRKKKKKPVRDGLRTCSDTSKNGAGVNVWVLDTGCTPANGGLCEGYYGGSNVCQDNHGHGEHVGGTVSHETYGVAPAATRSCVKVLSDSGSGSYSNVIKGIGYAVENKNRFGKGDVINMSLGGPKYDPVNNAVQEARKEGIFFALAAGNSADNACNYSPASTSGGGIFTVQAHDENLNAASFTNYATKELKCTDLSAPGVAIESVGGKKSGTSMASPHVAGGCAILLSDGLKPTKKRLTANSVRIKRSGALRRRALGLACA